MSKPQWPSEENIDTIGQNGLPLQPIDCIISTHKIENEENDMAFKPGNLHHNYSHGHATNGYTGAYKSWVSMRRRCSPKGAISHPVYVNISVCDNWQYSFEEFHKYMGDRPDGHTLDRINPSGDYEPGNCRWADSKVQSLNRASTILTEVRGEVLCLLDISKKYGIPNTTVNRRYKQGVRGEALIDPRNRNRKRNGSSMPNSKLDEKKVLLIKMALSSGASGSSLAKEYGVSQPIISDIARGATWSHVKT